MFTPGEVTVCPYLIFAAKTPQSQHDPAEFIVGNILTDSYIAERLDAYNFARSYPMGANPTCRSMRHRRTAVERLPSGGDLRRRTHRRRSTLRSARSPTAERRLLPLMPA